MKGYLEKDRTLKKHSSLGLKKFCLDRNYATVVTNYKMTKVLTLTMKSGDTNYIPPTTYTKL